MATDPTSDAMTLVEAVELLGVSDAFAQQLVDGELLGPVDPSGRLARADVLAYERRRHQRLAAVADVTAADAAAGVPYR
jgi:hypothetical protein